MVGETHIDIQKSVEELDALVRQQNKPKNCVSNPDFCRILSTITY